MRTARPYVLPLWLCLFLPAALWGCASLLINRPTLFASILEEPIAVLEGDQYVTSWSPDGSQLTLMSEQGRNWNLWSIRSDGSGLTRLTDDPAADTAASWSPDGRRIVLSSDRVNRVWPDLWLLDPAAPSVTERLTRGDGKYFFPAWSPDGGRIAYVFFGTGVLDLELRYLTLSNRAVRVLSTDRIVFSQIAWSPDGRRIAFSSSRTGNSEIWIATLTDPPAFEQLTDNPAIDANPSWSPDGHYIVFASTRTGNKDLWVTALSDPSAAQRLTSHPGADDYPRWSPDGRSIAFTSDRQGTLDPWRLIVQP